MTLIELLIIIAILGVLSTLANSWYQGYIESARVNNAIAQIAALSLVIDDYMIENGEPPSTLSDIRNANLIDPWGRPYEYLKINLQNPGSYSANERSSGGNAYASVSASFASRQSAYDDDDDDDDRDNSDSDNDERDNDDDRNDNENNSSNSNDGYDDNSRDDYYDDDDSSATTANARKNNGVLLNTDYDLYSRGQDGDSAVPLAVSVSQDDVLRANNGGFIGLVSTF